MWRLVLFGVFIVVSFLIKIFEGLRFVFVVVVWFICGVLSIECVIGFFVICLFWNIFLLFMFCCRVEEDGRVFNLVFVWIMFVFFKVLVFVGVIVMFDMIWECVIKFVVMIDWKFGRNWVVIESWLVIWGDYWLISW